MSEYHKLKIMRKIFEVPTISEWENRDPIRSMKEWRSIGFTFGFNPFDWQLRFTWFRTAWGFQQDRLRMYVGPVTLVIGFYSTDYSKKKY